MSDTLATLKKSATRFFSGTLLSRVTGMLRDMAMAYAFGAHSAVAALLVAFRLSHLLRRLLGEGAMQSAFIPLFEEIRHSDKRMAAQFFCDLKSTLAVLLFVLIAAAMAALGGVLFLEIPSLSGQEEIVRLLLIMMPGLLFICLFGINSAFLQCEKDYLVTSAAPVAFNAVWIIGIFCSCHLPIAEAMIRLAKFIAIASMVQWTITLPKTFRLLKPYGLASLWQKTKIYSDSVKKLARPLSLGIAGLAAGQVNSGLDALFARAAESQGPALLWYAIRIQQLPLALFGIALSYALLPPLSRAFKASNFEQSRRFMHFALEACAMLMIPMTSALLIFGKEAIALLYGHGDFDQGAIQGCADALYGYSYGLLPMSATLILAPAFYASGDYKIPSMASALAVIINLILNILFVYVIPLGASGIAVATSISSWANFLLLAYFLNTTFGSALIAWPPFIITAAKVAGITLGACLVSSPLVSLAAKSLLFIACAHRKRDGECALVEAARH